MGLSCSLIFIFHRILSFFHFWVASFFFLFSVFCFMDWLCDSFLHQPSFPLLSFSTQLWLRPWCARRLHDCGSLPVGTHSRTTSLISTLVNSFWWLRFRSWSHHSAAGKSLWKRDKKRLCQYGAFLFVLLVSSLLCRLFIDIYIYLYIYILPYVVASLYSISPLTPHHPDPLLPSFHPDPLLSSFSWGTPYPYLSFLHNIILLCFIIILLIRLSFSLFTMGLGYGLRVGVMVRVTLWYQIILFIYH